MNSEKELREIIGNLKSHLCFNKEMGLEPPQLSSKALEYLMNGIRSNNRIADEYIETSSKQEGSTTDQISINTSNSNESQLRRDISNVTSINELKKLIGDCKRCKLEQGKDKYRFW